MPRKSAPLPRKTKLKAARKHKARIMGRSRTSIAGYIPTLSMEQKRLAAYELRLEYHSFQDIGTALGVDSETARGYVVHVGKDMKEKLAAEAPFVLAQELDRIDRQLLHWYKASKKDIKASELVLHWTEQKHKILGLNINKTELGPPGSLSVTASSIDISKLNDEELGWLEIIWNKAGPQLPQDKATALEHRPSKTREEDDEEDEDD